MSRSRVIPFLLAGCLVAAAATPAAAQDGQDGQQPPIAVENDEEMVVLNPKEGGWQIRDLFTAISEMTGASILYEEQNAVIKGKKITFIGTQAIPKARLFDWLQAILSYHGLVLVPVGPKGPLGQQQWFALDQANANLTSRPVYIEEDQIKDFADRDGLYVVTSLKLKHIKDTSRVRQALSQMSRRAKPRSGAARVARRRRPQTPRGRPVSRSSIRMRP